MKLLFNIDSNHFSFMGTKQEIESIIRIMYRMGKEVPKNILTSMFKPSDRLLIQNLTIEFERIIKEIEKHDMFQ